MLLNKRDKTSPTLLENSETTQSLPSPTVKPSRSGPLKLSSSKNKNRPKSKQVDPGKPDTQPDHSRTNVTKELATSSSDSLTQPNDSTTKVTKELATSSSDSFTATTSSVSVNENIEKQQQKTDGACIHSSMDDQGLQPVTTSELLLLASMENAEVSTTSTSDVKEVVTSDKENQPEVSSNPVQHVTEDVDNSLAISPATTSEPVDSQTATIEVNLTDAMEDTESNKAKSESNPDKETMSSSPVPLVAEEIKIIATPLSDEIFSTAECVVVSKETTTNDPATEPVSDINKQQTEPSQTSEAVVTNSTAEQSNTLQEEDKIVEEKQLEQVSDGIHLVEMQKVEDDNAEGSLPTIGIIPTVVNSNQEASSDSQCHDKNNYEEELQQLKNVSVTQTGANLGFANRRQAKHSNVSLKQGVWPQKLTCHFCTLQNATTYTV